MKFLLKPVGLILNLVVEITTGILIEPELDIGPGFYIGHYGSIFIGGKTKYGKFLNISQECTIGYGGRGAEYWLPEIGDFVYIAPGAKIFCKIKIGNFVDVVANEVKGPDVLAGLLGLPAI